MTDILHKDEAHRLIDQMPPDATWEDLMHQIYVRKTVEKGLADSMEGRISHVSEVRAKYGIDK
jgi:hypothetical protein